MLPTAPEESGRLPAGWERRGAGSPGPRGCGSGLSTVALSPAAGYARILLLFLAFYFMPSDPGPAAASYLLSGLLDAVDGHAARALNQGRAPGGLGRACAPAPGGLGGGGLGGRGSVSDSSPPAAGTRFGAMLDMLTDRCATMCLLVNLALLDPPRALLYQLSMSLDVASHWLHLHRWAGPGGALRAGGFGSHPR